MEEMETGPMETPKLESWALYSLYCSLLLGPPCLTPCSLVLDGSHDDLVPLDIGFPTFESLVKIEKRVARCPSKIHPGSQDLSECPVKGRLSIQKKTEDWFLVHMERVVDSFSQEDSSMFMGKTLGLKLCFSLCCSPGRFSQISDVFVRAFG